MQYEERIKRRIKRNMESVPEETEIDQDTVEQVIDDSVTVDESFPIYAITASEFDSHSRKPTNIDVELDIETAFTVLAQSGHLTGDPTGAFAAVSSLCALVSRKTKIDLEPETGFVYWVAYDNQKGAWEVPKQDLIDLAVEKSTQMDVHFELTEDEVNARITRLCDINSFQREHKNGEVYLVLRERCSSDWAR